MVSKRFPPLDRIDIKILVTLQHDGRSTIQKLAESVALSSRACLERVRRLESAGIISGYRAQIELGMLSQPVQVVVDIVLEKHGRQEYFEQRLLGIEEIVECWEVSGDVDYIARFICPDLARYEELTATLIDDPQLGIARIVSHIVLRPVRKFTGYPKSLLFRKTD